MVELPIRYSHIQIGGEESLMASSWGRQAVGVSDVDRVAWCQALRKHAFGCDLSDSDWEQVQAQLAFAELPAGTQLIREGDEPDGLYILLRGRGRVWAGTPEQAIGELFPGEVMGELALLSNHRRNASIRIVRDSIIAWLSKDSFEALADTAPSFIRALGRVAAERAIGKSVWAGAKRTSAETISLLPIDTGIDVAKMAHDMAQTLSAFGNVAVMIAQSANSAVNSATLSASFSACELRNDFVIYVGELDESEWTRQCALHADRILLVADATAGPQRRKQEAYLLRQLPRDSSNEYQLILVHPVECTAITGTKAWLEMRQAAAHHHLRRGLQTDIARIARLVVHRAIGVAFSGASSRGIAHVGLLEGMAQLGIPVDIAAGNSSGSGVAILAAMQLTPVEIFNRLAKVAPLLMPSAGDMGPPFLSIFSGWQAQRALKALVGDILLEDLPIPCVVTTVDISRGKYVEIKQGAAWLGARASGSLPGFWPPVANEDGVFVDGGILANMPLESIEEHCRDGLVLGSDFNGSGDNDFKAFQSIERYGDALSGWKILFDKIMPWRKKRSYPSLYDVLFHTMCISSYQHQNRLNRRHDDNIIILRPQLGDYGFFEVTPEIMRGLTDRVRSHALENLTSVWEGRASQWVNVGTHDEA